MYKLIKYNEEYKNIWDKFVCVSNQGTFLHTRKYIEYHKDRFIDKSLIIKSKDKIVAVFPADIDPINKNLIISHPGLTYGGVLFTNNIYGDRVNEIIKLIFDYYFISGFKKLIYKAVPFIYHKIPSQDDIYFLKRLKAVNYRIDLSCTLDLSEKRFISKRRERSLKNAQKQSMEFFEDFNEIELCWEILENNLKRKFNALPVHNIYEIKELIKLFPNNISCFYAKLGNEVMASIILYKNYNVWHTQYISTTTKGININAIDFLMDKIIKIAKKNKIRWFDFGTSNENEGEFLNYDLYNFKHSFGSGGTLHNFYKIDKNIFIKNK